MTENRERSQITPNRLLEQITHAIETGRFPRIPTPAFTYAYLRHLASSAGIEQFETYFSTAITSGGAALPDTDGNNLPFHEAMMRNTDYAFALAAAAITDNPTLIADETSVNPVALGKIPRYHFETYGTHKVDDGSWGQDDYLRFWFAVILGLAAPEREGGDESRWYDTELYLETLFETHRQLVDDKGIASKMDDRSLPTEERKQAYLDFTYSFLSCVNHMNNTAGLTMTPVNQIVELIDTERSLGCSAESELGGLVGVPALKLALTSDNWHERQLGNVTDDLLTRGARFSIPTGKVALALAHKRQSGQTASDIRLPEELKRQLESPFRYPVERFMKGITIRTEDPTMRSLYQGLAAEFEFGSRRPKSYSPHALDELSNPD